MKKTQKRALAVGAGVAAIAAAAVGTYFLTGKHAKNRKKLAKWAGQMQADVAKEVSKASKVTRANYNKVVDQVAKNYKGIKSVSAPELNALVSDLKKHWDVINSEVSAASASVKKIVPKAVKSVAKKVKVSSAKKKVAKKASKKSRR